MQRCFSIATVVIGLLAAPAASAGDGETVVAQACGYYIVLGCFGRHAEAAARMNSLGGAGIGGAGIGGSAGTQIVHTNDFPNFRNGFFCVADGPYHARGDAESIAWQEVVPDSYVKNGC